MNSSNKAIAVLLIVASLLITGAVYAYILANGNESIDRFLEIGFDKEVLGNGTTIELTVTHLSDSEIDFQLSRIFVTTPSNQYGVLDLKNVTWIGNDSAIYPMPSGYEIMLNRTGPHDFWAIGDKIRVSGQGGKLAAGTWMVAVVYSPHGGTMGWVQQTIE